MRGVGIVIEGLKLGGKFFAYRCDCRIWTVTEEMC